MQRTSPDYKAREQGNNTRSCRKITYKGKTKTMRGWEEEMGLSKGVIYWRLKHGWSEKEAIETKRRAPRGRTTEGAGWKQ